MDRGNPDTGWKQRLRARWQWLVVAGAVIGLSAVTIGMNWDFFRGTDAPRVEPRPAPSAAKVEPAPPVPPVDLAAIRRRAWEKITPRLLEAETAGRAQIDDCLQEFSDFLKERKQGVPQFSREILSLSGKWQLVRGKLPFAAKDRHVRYLSDQFDKHVFKPEELKAALETTVARYVKSLQSLENELLVQCRADISESELAAVQAIPVAATQEDFANEFERLVKSVVADVQLGLGVEVTQTVAALIAADVAVVVVRQVGAAVATQLGIDAGILGAGASAGWATFGVSLVAAIIVDIALDKIIKAAGYDPAKKVAAKVDASLDKLHDLIIDGDAETREKYDALKKIAASDPSARLRAKASAAIRAIENSGRLGLRQDLIRLNELRAKLRTEALKRLVLQGDTL